jgi:thioredoxin:protein disulfide reductase
MRKLNWPTWVCGLFLMLAMAGAAIAADEFLEPDVAFELTTRAADARTVELTLTVAPGYYLYREQFKVAAPQATLGPVDIPRGVVKFDETFQKDVETHRGVLFIQVPVQAAPSRFELQVTSQGCADKGLCYPPAQRNFSVSLAGFGGDGSVRLLPATSEAAAPPALSSSNAASATGLSRGQTTGGQATGEATTGRVEAALRSGELGMVVGVFFVAGLLLSLTPCVLPMLPILSSIIVGQGAQVSKMRGLGLALSYSLGMALVYTALGVAAGLAGEGLAATLQQPWVLVLFAAGLVVLSLSMFGVYELQLPVALRGRLTQSSQRLPGGRVASVFAMGAVSALIVSPCVAAPLAGALVYISQTRNVGLGGTALFCLAAGMSVPLLLLGASAGAWLPRAGAWMTELKRLFGGLLLAVALWMVQPLLPASLALALWGGLLLSAAILLLASGWASSRLWRRCVGSVLALCAVLQLTGAASGGTDPLQPLAHWAAGLSGAASRKSLAFAPVRSVTELDEALRRADGRRVMLDFYADWCVSCKEMERFTFTDAAVQAKLADAVLLKADVTANNAQDRALLKRFGLFGPPGTLFFDEQGQELSALRVVGYQNSKLFLQSLAAAGFD